MVAYIWPIPQQMCFPMRHPKNSFEEIVPLFTTVDHKKSVKKFKFSLGLLTPTA